MNEHIPPFLLDYASQTFRSAPRRLLQVSLLLGCFPLTAGLVILFLYWLTDMEVFVGMGTTC